MKRIRYDQLRAGDVINWHGAKEIVLETVDSGESEYYPGERLIGFTITPADEEAEKMLGFYCRGEYGGVGFLTVELIERPVIGRK